MVRIHSCCCFNVCKAQCHKFLSTAYKFENFIQDLSLLQTYCLIYIQIKILPTHHKGIESIHQSQSCSFHKDGAPPEVPLDLNLQSTPNPAPSRNRLPRICSWEGHQGYREELQKTPLAFSAFSLNCDRAAISPIPPALVDTEMTVSTSQWGD